MGAIYRYSLKPLNAYANCSSSDQKIWWCSLHMDGALLDRERRFLDRLGERRMGVAGAGDVLGRRAELHRDRAFHYEVARLRPDDVDAEHPIGCRIRQDFHEAVRRAVDLGAAVGRERELADVVGDAVLFQLLLGLADGGDLRRGVDD